MSSDYGPDPQDYERSASSESSEDRDETSRAESAELLPHRPSDEWTALAGLTLVACVLTAVFAYRYTHELWPTYIFLCLLLVHALTLALSGGRGLLAAALVMICLSVSWLLWVIFDEEALRWFNEAPDRKQGVAAAAGAGVVAYTFLFASATMPVLSGSGKGIYYLVAVSAVLSLWGIWGVMVQLGEVRDWLIYGTLGSIGVAAVALFWFVDDENRMGDEVRVEDETGRNGYRVIARWWLFVGYVSGVVALSELADTIVTSFLPNLLNHTTLNYDFPSTPEPIRWRGFLPLAGLCVGFIGLLAISLVDAVREFKAHPLQHEQRGKLKLRRTTEKQGFDRLLTDVDRMMFELGVAATNAIRLTIDVLIRLCRALVQTARHLWSYGIHVSKLLVVPLLGFSLIAVGLIFVLEEHTSPGAQLNDFRTWSEIMTLGTAIVLLAFLSFFLIDPEGEPFNNMLVLAFVGWLGLSMLGGAVSSFIWLGREVTEVESAGLNAAVPNRVILINLAVAALTVAVAWVMVATTYDPSQAERRVLAVLAAGIPVALAIPVGLPAIVDGLIKAT